MLLAYHRTMQWVIYELIRKEPHIYYSSVTLIYCCNMRNFRIKYRTCVVILICYVFQALIRFIQWINNQQILFNFMVFFIYNIFTNMFRSLILPSSGWCFLVQECSCSLKCHVINKNVSKLKCICWLFI
jgi:hypothetical protein